MTVEQAKARILDLARAESGYLTAAIVGADAALAENPDVASAAAHELASDPAVIVGEETDSRAWFPFSFMRFSLT